MDVSGLEGTSLLLEAKEAPTSIILGNIPGNSEGRTTVLNLVTVDAINLEERRQPLQSMGEFHHYPFEELP